MTFIVKKSLVDRVPGFEMAVAAHAKELRDWLDREKNVARDALNPDIPDEDRWVSCPRPLAPNDLVDQAVNEDGAADYLIENDDPTPRDLLPVKKQNLVALIQRAENEARNAVIPVTKRMLHEMKVANVRKIEYEIRSEVIARAEAQNTAELEQHNKAVADILADKPGVIVTAATKLGIVEDKISTRLAALPQPNIAVVDLDATIAETRSEAEVEMFRLNDEIQSKQDAITWAAAQALSDVEDLTVDDVDAYQIPDLTPKD